MTNRRAWCPPGGSGPRFRRLHRPARDPLAGTAGTRRAEPRGGTQVTPEAHPRQGPSALVTGPVTGMD
jgi:hypothetical protein